MKNIATFAVALSCLALAALPQSSPLAFDRQAIFSGEVWRLWSGHLVHFSNQQMFLDVSTLLLAGAIAEKELGSRFTAVALLLGMPTLSLGLLLVAPDLAQYRGASGLAMLLAFAAGAAFWVRQPGLRVILAMLGVAVAVKAVLDAAGVVWDMTGLPSGVKVAWQAHVLGAGFGWASARLKLKERV